MEESALIFLSVGTQKFQMNRLLKQIDKSIEEKQITEQIFAQTGYSDYIPQYYNYVRFMNMDVFEKKINSCNIFITHAGTGNIITAVQYHRPIIIVPRLQAYREHVDNHQEEIAEKIAGQGNIWVCYDCSRLPLVIRKIGDGVETNDGLIETKAENLILDYIRSH